MLQRHVATLLWRVLALVCVALALVGVVLPGLPTVPFLIVAAWAGGRGWPALEARVLAHSRYGPIVREWRERGCVPRRAKWVASTMMVASAVVMWFTGMPRWLFGAVCATMSVVAIWLWRRPES